MEAFDWTLAPRPRRVLIVGGRAEHVDAVRMTILNARIVDTVQRALAAATCVDNDNDDDDDDMAIVVRRTFVHLVTNTKRTCLWSLPNVERAAVAYSDADVSERVREMCALADASATTGGGGGDHFITPMLIVDCDRGELLTARTVCSVLAANSDVATTIVNARDMSAYGDAVRGGGAFDAVVVLRLSRVAERDALFDGLAPLLTTAGGTPTIDRPAFDALVDEHTRGDGAIVVCGGTMWTMRLLAETTGGRCRADDDDDDDVADQSGAPTAPIDNDQNGQAPHQLAQSPCVVQ